METKACQPGSTYLQTWIRFQTQMPLDTRMMNFLMLDWSYDATLEALRHQFLHMLPLWRGVHIESIHKSIACEYNPCQPALDRW